MVFENSKTKVFHLSGVTGRFVLDSIERTINEQASEWRAIPSVTSDPGRIGTDLAAITTANGDARDGCFSTVSWRGADLDQLGRPFAQGRPALVVDDAGETMAVLAAGHETDVVM